MSAAPRVSRLATLQLATTNPGKLREFRLAAKDLGIKIAGVPGFDSVPACIEDGRTFAANARKKALYYSGFATGLVFADDSGLAVDALGGAPGVYSARFAGPGATDEMNNQKLVLELAGAPERSRVRIKSPPYSGFPASYVCVIALAESGKLLGTVEGRVAGVIIDTPRGRGGFGYDPFFFYPPWAKTFAQISARRKFTVSHRGNAFRKLLALLDRLQSA